VKEIRVMVSARILFIILYIRSNVMGVTFRVFYLLLNLIHALYIRMIKPVFDSKRSFLETTRPKNHDVPADFRISLPDRGNNSHLRITQASYMRGWSVRLYRELHILDDESYCLFGKPESVFPSQLAEQMLDRFFNSHISTSAREEYLETVRPVIEASHRSARSALVIKNF